MVFGWFKKLTSGLSKSSEKISDGIKKVIKGKKIDETTTIGQRNYIKSRYILKKEIKKISHFNIKESKRPSGKFTKKVESNDLKNYSYKNRKSIKSKIENN